jgi:lysophospholipid acyltransferase (LPLAT)-like uncharacterized protein
MKVREPDPSRGQSTGTWHRHFLERMLFGAVDLWLMSCRPVVVGREVIRPFFEPGHPAILALWHCALIYTLFHCRREPGVIMVSGSSDGDWVADYISSHGQVPFRGSRHKGGLEALKGMAELVREKGLNAGIVADGSRGPARIAQKGAVILARDTGTPVIPSGMAAHPVKRFNSWDRTMLPYPASRIVMVYEEPITVPATARGPEIEAYRKKLEDGLNEATRRAEEVLDGARSLKD